MASKRNFPTKQEIEEAVAGVCSEGPLDRKVVIEKSLGRYGYTAEELRDRSCESLSTRLKSLTGVVINEMLAASRLTTVQDGRLALPAPVEEKKTLTRTQKRRELRKRAAARAKEAPKYPDTPIGKLLAHADKRYNECRAKKITEEQYAASLKRAVIKAISEAGGEFFEELSMKILLALYGESVRSNELTAGPDDNGIDGKIVIRDPAGFEELIFFQSKTKLNERAYVSIKVAREFLGVMTAYGATKGILITNSRFHRETKAFAAKTRHLRLIDDSELFALMARSGAGIKTVDGLLHIDDGLFLNCR